MALRLSLELMKDLRNKIEFDLKMRIRFGERDGSRWISSIQRSERD